MRRAVMYDVGNGSSFSQGVESTYVVNWIRKCFPFKNSPQNVPF